MVWYGSVKWGLIPANSRRRFPGLIEGRSLSLSKGGPLRIPGLRQAQPPDILVPGTVERRSLSLSKGGPVRIPGLRSFDRLRNRKLMDLRLKYRKAQRPGIAVAVINAHRCPLMGALRRFPGSCRYSKTASKAFRIKFTRQLPRIK